jgi:hypothetical protein
MLYEFTCYDVDCCQLNLNLFWRLLPSPDSQVGESLRLHVERLVVPRIVVMGCYVTEFNGNYFTTGFATYQKLQANRASAHCAIKHVGPRQLYRV